MGKQPGWRVHFGKAKVESAMPRPRKHELREKYGFKPPPLSMPIVVKPTFEEAEEDDLDAMVRRSIERDGA